MAELIKVKSCPFCGSDNVRLQYVNEEGTACCVEDKDEFEEDCSLVHCYECHADFIPNGGKAREVLEAWNNRVTEAEIRAKAIDEFAEKLKNKLVLKYGNATPTEQYVAMQVDAWCKEIAEQLKGE